MNYDLFIPPATVERAYVSSVSSTRTSPVRASGRTGDGGINGLANPGHSQGTVAGETASEMVERTVAALNEVFDQTQMSLRFKMDDTTGDLVVSIVDRDSGEVMRQMPADQILRMRQRLQELMGVMFDATA